MPENVARLTKTLTGVKYPVEKDQVFSSIFKNIKAKNVAGLILTIIILWIIITGCSMAQETIEMKIFPKHLGHVRTVMFKKLVQRHEEEYHDVPSAEAIARVMDVSRLYSYLSDVILSRFIPYSIGIIVIIAYAFRTNRMLGTITTVGLCSIVANCLCWGGAIVNASATREHKYINMVEGMNDNLNNLMNVYINNEAESTIKANEDLNIEHTLHFEKELALARNSNVTTTALSVVVFVILLWQGFVQVKKKKMTGFQLAALITIYVMYMHWSMDLFHELPYLYRRLGIWKNSEKFVMNIFNPPGSNRSRFKIKNGHIQLVNVSFKYPKTDLTTVHDININIHPGEKVAIVGRSGSGKTTIMKLILQMYSPSSGKILIDGRDASTIDLNEIRSSINYVNQRTLLLNDTVTNNISYGNDATRQEVLAFMTKYDLMPIFAEIENGIDASAGFNGGNLSVGMQKTVLLVRGLLRKRSIVYIFDEPLSGLDPDSRKKVMHMISEECKNKTIICITHNEEITNYVDRVIALTTSPVVNLGHYAKRY